MRGLPHIPRHCSGRSHRKTPLGIEPVNNGRLLQNLILAANYIQSHILHFYHLAALDFVDIKAVLNYSGNGQNPSGA